MADLTRSHRIIFLLLVIVVLGLPSCRQEEASPTTAPPTPVIATRTALPLPTASPAATPTATPSPTATPPPLPAITAADQVLDESGRLVVAEVLAPEGGWLVLHAREPAGPVLAVQQLAPGSSRDLGLTVDPYAATETVVAVLHEDAGTLGTFDFPGADGPVSLDGEPVQATLTLTINVPQPLLLVSDQAVGEEGTVRVDELVAPGPAWLVVYAQDGDDPPDLLGYTPVPSGRSREIVVTINWRKAGPNLVLALLRDDGTLRRFDEDEPPVLSAGNPVTATLRATYPPDLIIYDQPVVADQVVVERVISNGPGWIVLYFDVDGQPGNIVGFSFLDDGLNTRVPITVVTSAVTPLLHVRLHEDTGDAGEFDLPGADQPVLDPDGRIPGFSFRTDLGPFVMVADQVVTETVSIPLVVATTDMWVVVRAESEGEPGPVIGQTWLPAGMHWDVAVAVDPADVTETLIAGLHQDAGTPQAFDFPDGPDQPLLQGREPVVVSFAAGLP